MECQKNFKKFHENILLNPTRIKRIEDAISALKIFVSNDKKEDEKDENGIGDVLIEIFPQGSYVQEMCIKPANEDEEFDVDMVLSLSLEKSSDSSSKPKDNPKTILKWLEKRLKYNGNYKNKIKEPKPRCVRISYEGDFHLDVVSVTPVESKNGILWIPDKSEGWNKTNPKGFILWCNDKEKASGGRFKRIVKFSKWWRSTIASDKANINSILLTTLLGHHITKGNTDAEALVETMESLDSWLQLCKSVPDIDNPSLSDENLARDWSDAEFTAFKKNFREATQNSRTALDETDLAKSIKLWQKVFGYKFPSSTDDDDVGDESKRIYIPPSASGKKAPREFAKCLWNQNMKKSL